MSGDALNLGARLRAHALARPDAAAIVHLAADGPRTLTYRALDHESDALARGMGSAGIGRGTRTTLMVRPGPELLAITFALFKLGAVPVVVDPGMGLGRMLHCHRAVGAEAFVGIPLAHAVRVASPRTFASVRACVTVGRRLGWGGRSLDELRDARDEPFALAATRADDLAVINFTTGSTGPPKGVEYTHRMGDAMADIIARYFDQGPGDVSLATLPLFSLFDVLIGTTSVLAPMDPTRPAEADGAALFDAIDRHAVRTMFASPALLSRLAAHGRSTGRTLPTLRTVMSGGAPVAPSIIESFRTLLAPEARLYAAYGATEALPIAAIESREILGPARERARRGAGTPVGRPPEGVSIRILDVDGDAPVAPGEVGEIAVRGANVSAHYHRAPELDARAKVIATDGLWHRTGDLGTLDDDGLVWLAGRASHVVRTREHGALCSVRWEGVFEAHPAVRRAALVGVGDDPEDQAPVVCIELHTSARHQDHVPIERALRALAEGCPVTRPAPTFLFHDGFPVDIRHNAKVVREELAAWAAMRLGLAPLLRPSPPMLVPVLGWLFVLVGLFVPLPPILAIVWWIDVVLSVFAHAAQLVRALPVGRRAGHSDAATIALTMLLGATWWRRLPPLDRPSIVVRE